MNIQPNSSDGTSPLRIDLTKRLRESIQHRQPLPPEAVPDAGAAAQAKGDEAQAVKDARDEHREQFRGRVSAQRERHTANHLDEHAAAVTKARAELSDELAKRKSATHAGTSESDSIDISPRAERLAKQAAERALSRDDAREARVRELRELYLDGKLDTDEIVRRAADKMLDA
jgi:anti-sigma28 factor (negative regulator of flagellin synthesis)